MGTLNLVAPLVLFEKSRLCAGTGFHLLPSFHHHSTQHNCTSLPRWASGYHNRLWIRGSRVRSRPGSMDFFQSVKILSMTSFGREVKPWVPCRRFTARKRTSSKICQTFHALYRKRRWWPKMLKSVVKPSSNFSEEIVIDWTHEKTTTLGGTEPIHSSWQCKESHRCCYGPLVPLAMGDCGTSTVGLLTR